GARLYRSRCCDLCYALGESYANPTVCPSVPADVRWRLPLRRRDPAHLLLTAATALMNSGTEGAGGNCLERVMSSYLNEPGRDALAAVASEHQQGPKDKRSGSHSSRRQRSTSRSTAIGIIEHLHQ